MSQPHLAFRRQAIAMAVCLALAGAAHAQSSNATLRGALTGPAASTANAEVVASNVDTGFTLRTRSGADGNYVIAGLPPGNYKITVTTPDGKKNESTVTLQVGQAASLDLAVGGTAAAGSSELNRVVVSGGPVVDRKTSEVGTYVTPQQMQRLPQVTRNFLSFADLAPGVNLSYDAEGNVKVRSGASTRDSLNVFIDGAGQKDYVLRGGISGQENSRGNPFPQSALAEYKIITQNYKAEFDQVASAAITAATKSGTNEFHGDAFYDHTGANMRAKTPGEKRDGFKSSTSQDQYGVSLGGPIIQDQLHYFIAYEGKKNKDPQTVVAGADNAPPGSNPAAALPPSALGLLGPVSVPFKEDLLFAKIDWTPFESHRIDLSVKVRQETDTKHIGKQETTPFGSDNIIDETRWDLKHQYSGERVTNEARVTFEKVTLTQQPLTDAPSVNYRYLKSAAEGGPSTDDGTLVLNVGGNNNYQQKGQRGYSIQDDLTLTGFELAGSHVFKFGGKIKWINVDAIEQYHRLPEYWYDINPDGGSLTQPFRLEFGAAVPGAGDGSVHAKNTQYGIYAQDDWEVNKNLTLNIGARYDYEKSPVYNNAVTPADVIAALNAADPSAPGQTYAQTLAKGGVDINQFISTGSNRKSFKDGFQPRLGFSYDLFGDKQHVIFGGAGRSYDRNIFDVIQLERTKGTFANYRLDFTGSPNSNCATVPTPTSCMAWNAAYLDPAALAALAGTGAGREIDLLTNNLKTPYSDQYSIGIRDAVGIWNTEASISHIINKDGFTWLLGNRRGPDGNFYEPGLDAGPPWGNGVPGFGGLILGTNGLESKTTSLFLKADKPYTRESGWGVTVAYTYSDSKENHNLKDDFSYSLDYPTVAQIPMIRSTVVPKHKLVSTGSIDAPWGILVAGKVTWASPLAIRGTLVGCTNPPANNVGCTDYVVDKASFRQVDMSLSKSFSLPAGVRLTLRADVLNIFNYTNYEDYDVSWGVNNVGTTRKPQGTLAGVPRTLKLGLAASW